MTAPTTTTDLPTVQEFLGTAAARLETVTALLAPRRWEDVDPVAAVRELTRVVAQLTAALRILTASEAA